MTDKLLVLILFAGCLIFGFFLNEIRVQSAYSAGEDQGYIQGFRYGVDQCGDPV